MRGGYFFIVLLALLSTACSTPAMRNDAFATANGFKRQVITGTDFSHLVFLNNIGINSSGEGKREWHVYIEGDGKAWTQQNVVAIDPTPTEPLMLQLMAQDAQAAIYLGRPCYHGMSSESACNPGHWTYGRYSEQVVESMRTALNTLVRKYEIESLVLIGHSGGGTLAMLLAERLPEVRLVVTLGGNLDIDAWTTKHGYTGLEYSLNPARRVPLARHIKQLHFVGADDKNVPPEMLRAAIKQQQNAQLLVLNGLGHQQGWNDYWTKILQAVDFPGGSYE